MPQDSPQHYDELQKVFLKLRDVEAEQRGVILAELDDSMRREVESLLAIDFDCDNFLEPAERSEATTEFSLPIAATAPKQVGPYRLLQKIGEGGFGTVYLAEQKEPIARRVAIKLIKPGMDSKQILARFHAERQALAMMDHPSIARVFDAGTTEQGSPYFAMELVKGIPINEFCDQQDLDLHARLQLIVQVCHAVHHAHQKGIIHRDLKPSNVLVTMGEVEPLAKVIDFGIAKALDTNLTLETLFTEHGQMIGTLEYMSPEQAEMSAIDIDTRSDVYSLGVLLYKLLTGETPLSRGDLLRGGVFDVPRAIRETEPATPSVRSSQLEKQRSKVGSTNRDHGVASPSGDLDWIAMKALAKDRRRRYESALDLARDIDRFVLGHPIEARPPTWSYLVSKYIQRNRKTALAGTLVFSSLVLGAIGLILGWQRANTALQQARQDRDDAVIARREADASNLQIATNMYGELLETAWRATQERDFRRANELLSKCPESLKGWEWRLVATQATEPKGGLLRQSGESAIVRLAQSRWRPWIAGVTDTGRIEIRELAGGKPKAAFNSEQDIELATFSPDGKLIAFAKSNGRIQLFDAESFSEVADQQSRLGPLYDFAFSPSGRKLAYCTGGSWLATIEASITETSTWTEATRLKLPTRMAKLAFLNDEDVITAGLDGTVYRIDPATSAMKTWKVTDSSLRGLEIMDSEEVVLLATHSAWKLDISRDGSNPVKLLETTAIASAIARGPNRSVLVGTGDGKVLIQAPAGETRTLASFGSAVRALKRLPQQDLLLVAVADGRVAGLPLLPEESSDEPSANELTAGIVLPRHGLAVTFDDGGRANVRKLDSEKSVRKVPLHDGNIRACATDADESFLVTVGDDQRLRCWELPELELRFEQPIAWGVRDVCVAADGSWIATAPPQAKEIGVQEGTIGLWNPATGRVFKQLAGHTNWVLKLAASPDGTRLASTDVERVTRLWNVHSGESISKITPKIRSAADHLAFDPAGASLYIGHRDGWVTTWKTSDGRATSEWPAFGDAISGLAVTPDGRLLVTSRSNPHLQIRNLASLQTIATLDLDVGYVAGFSLAASGQYFLCVGAKDQAMLRINDDMISEQHKTASGTPMQWKSID